MKKHTLLLACAMRILLNLIALLFQGGKGVAMLEGVSLKKSSKIFTIFSKIAVPRYLYSRGT